MASLVLLPKPGRTLDDPAAYRPLCMLDASGKLFEKLLVKRLRDNYSNDVISNRQYGYRQGRSTIDAMSYLKSLVSDANGRGRRNLYVGMLTVDVRNAFSCAPCSGILDAL